VKRFFHLVILFIFAPFILFSQSTNTKLKAGFESGIINTQRFGDGLIFRPFLKINGQRKFTKSIIRIKTNVSSEILNLNDRINGIHLFANLEYVLSFGAGKLLLNGLAKNQTHIIKSANKQMFNEFQARIQYSHSFSKNLSVQIKEWLIYREQDTANNSTLQKNTQQTDFMIKRPSGHIWKLGFFHEFSNFGYQDKERDRHRRFGPSVEYTHKKNIILNAGYKYGFYKNNRLNDHQINVLAGKYLSKKISLFLFAYYLWRLNEDPENDNQAFNPLESYNNISLKIGYDLKKKTHVFVKFLYEEQEIFQLANKVSTFQGLLGFQQSF